MTVTVLDRALVAGEVGQVPGERQEGPDPEMPEKAPGARSPRSTSWTWWPSTTLRQRVRSARCCAGRACIQPRNRVATGLGCRRAGGAGHGASRRLILRDAQIARLRKEKAKLEQELARPASWNEPEMAAESLSHPAVSVDALQNAREEIEQRAHVCLPHADDVLISVPGAFVTIPDDRGIAALLANRHRQSPGHLARFARRPRRQRSSSSAYGTPIRRSTPASLLAKYRPGSLGLSGRSTHAPRSASVVRGPPGPSADKAAPIRP